MIINQIKHAVHLKKNELGLLQPFIIGCLPKKEILPIDCNLFPLIGEDIHSLMSSFYCMTFCRLLITEAQKAAKSLELAAMKSPIAQTSLMETRKLIDEAIQSIESIENGQITSYVNGEYPSTASADLVSQVQKETGVDKRDSDEGDHREVNGSQILSLNEIEGLDFTNLTLQGMVNGEKELSPRGSSYGLSTFNLDDMIVQSASAKKLGQLEPYGNINPEKSPLLNGAKVRQLETNGNTKCVNDPLPNGAKLQLMEGERPLTITRKWVRGRLVEVTEGA